MHEISLVQNLLQQLHDIARQHQAERVITVKMIIGPLSGVVVESFTFGFDILTKQDPLFRDASLKIVVPQVTYRCSSCNAEVTTSGERPEKCEACAESLMIPNGGDDLILQQVEME